jgi:hypothetical protein
MTRRLLLGILVATGLIGATGLVAQPTPRGTSAVRAFKIATGFPQGRPGFVVDHVRPLCAGGADAIANLRWEPLAESRRKDADERRLCVLLRQFERRWVVPTAARP